MDYVLPTTANVPQMIEEALDNVDDLELLPESYRKLAFLTVPLVNPGWRKYFPKLILSATINMQMRGSVRCRFKVAAGPHFNAV